MKFHELTASANKNKKRVGRGIAAGQGKTAGRGTKGQKARTGGGTRPGFEGGQTPLTNRLPKLRGFKAIRPKAETVYTGQLNDLGAKIDNFSLAEAGLTSSPYVVVKVLVKGEVTKKVTVSLQAASATAVAAIQKAGGTFSPVARLQREAKKTDKTEK